MGCLKPASVLGAWLCRRHQHQFIGINVLNRPDPREHVATHPTSIRRATPATLAIGIAPAPIVKRPSLQQIRCGTRVDARGLPRFPFVVHRVLNARVKEPTGAARNPPTLSMTNDVNRRS